MERPKNRDLMPFLRPSNTSPVWSKTPARRAGSPWPKETVRERYRNGGPGVFALTELPQKEEKVKEKKKPKKVQVGTEITPFTRSKRRDQDPDKVGNGFGSSMASAIVLGLFDKEGGEILQDAEIFIDSKNNTVHSFVGEILECEDKFYSKIPLSIKIQREYWWLIACMVAAAFAFTVILIVYWPVFQWLKNKWGELLKLSANGMNELGDKCSGRIAQDTILAANKFNQKRNRREIPEELVEEHQRLCGSSD
jgi:hypothetical protein